jgi:hypothetical protein
MISSLLGLFASICHQVVWVPCLHIISGFFLQILEIYAFCSVITFPFVYTSIFYINACNDFLGSLKCRQAVDSVL